MISIKKNFLSNLLHSFPVVILFILVFTGFDLSFFIFGNNFSFNFISIVIFYWVLKKPNMLGYGFIFFAGIINDVVQNFPIGISSINYLLLCAIAAFIRARTILPNLLYDWLIFFVAILIVSSIDYSVLSIIFNFPIEYETLMFNSLITFLIYPIFSKIFDQINLLNLKGKDVK
tara:strand:- start:249 stop:770 length:522 start_codon:yes stop_codon:yes gene_type:complete